MREVGGLEVRASVATAGVRLEEVCLKIKGRLRENHDRDMRKLDDKLRNALCGQNDPIGVLPNHRGF